MRASMAGAEEDKRNETSSRWDKPWIFVLAGLCVVSLTGLGFWGRIRMLEDDNASMQKKLDDETQVHEEQELAMVNRLKHKSSVLHDVRQELTVAMNHFQQINASMRNVKEHFGDALQQAVEEPSEFLSECQGVTLPHGFEYTLSNGQALFPYDVARDTTGLYSLLKSNDSLGSLYDVTTSAEKAGLFIRPTFPWAQYTWLKALSDQEDLTGNFTEWGVGAGGSMMFLGALARLRGVSVAGLDAWETEAGAKQHQEKFAQSVETCGLSGKDVELFDLSAPHIAWPEAGHSERLSFTHIDSDDYKTTLGILGVVYDSTLDGGIFAVDNFFHASGGSKKAVQEFFSARTPGQMPVIYPVFPGLSVLIVKGRFASTNDSLKPNVLDGNYYSFKYVKGQTELFDSVNRSVSQLSRVHRGAKSNPGSNQTAVCWLGLALNNARNLRDFIMSSEEAAEDFEAADLFRFMTGNSQFIQSAPAA